MTDIPVDTPFMRVRNALAPCRVMADLVRVWALHQENMKALVPGERNALIAMKDYYKNLITRGEMNDYQEIRATASNRQWSGKEPQIGPVRAFIPTKTKKRTGRR